MSQHITSETWRPVPGHEGHYEVSNFGRVKSLKTRARGQYGRILKVTPGPKGYAFLTLIKAGGERRPSHVHRLVAAAFLGPCPAGLQVNHIDGDKLNNRAGNLEYVTVGDNLRHAVATGLNRVRGEHNANAKLRNHEAAQLRADRKRGLLLRQLAEKYGISISAASYICRGVSYADAN